MGGATRPSPEPLPAHAPGSASPRDDGQIVLLQFLRGLAASGVVVEHLLERYAKRGALPEALPQLVSNLGQTGVAAFFAISGFLMVSISLRRGRDTPSGSSFFVRRILRIVPLYYLSTLLVVAFRWTTFSLSTNQRFRFPTGAEVIQTLLFIPHRGANGLIQPIYGLGWTLHYEMFFYLLFAVGLALARRAGVWLVLVGLVALVAIGPWVSAPPDSHGLRLITYVFTRPILLYFAAGMLVALIHIRLEGFRLRFPWLAIAAIVLGGLLLAAVDVSEPVSLAAITVALLFTVLPAQRAGPSRLLAFFRAFGDASYSIYLTHSFVLGGFAALTATLAATGGVGLALSAVLGSLLCFAVGWVVWRFVERPMDEFLRGKAFRRAAAP